MIKSMLKVILGGIMFGTLAFFAGPFILIVLLLKFIFTPFGMGRTMMMRGHYAHMGYGRGMDGDRIRKMSDEEYEQYRNQSNQWKHYGCTVNTESH
jgi:hypothetical protein